MPQSVRPVADTATRQLVNVAIGKHTQQSSLSPWSSPGECGGAVSGEWPDDFAFHTDMEEQPWWMVDLGTAYPIEAIVVHNRLRMLGERARRLRIEVSLDALTWTLIHAGFADFSGGDVGRPFEAWLGSHLSARFVRLSLDATEYFHLAQVEVLARPEVFSFVALCDRTGLSRELLTASSSGSPYEIEGADRPGRSEIVGLRINYSGRFGNLLHQYINAIQIAERTGLSTIQLGSHELLNAPHAFSVGDIGFLPATAALPHTGMFLSGEFFNSDDFAPVLGPFLRFSAADEAESTRVVQTYIRPHMLTGLPLPDETHPDDELTVHLRAGDIFSSDHPVTYGYRQPPLSFYELIIGRMMAAGTINRVRLVFEDRGNPCVDALEHLLTQQRIPYRTSEGSLRDDLSALIDAPHLVFGHGTFGYAACRLSKRIKTVHYFAPELGGSYGFIPTIDQVFEVSDQAGRYIRAYQYGVDFGPDEGWRNTPEMRELMLTYPMSDLSLRELPPPSGRLHHAAE